jgi:hypothetical protein
MTITHVRAGEDRSTFKNQSVSGKWLKSLIVQIERQNDPSYSVLKISYSCNSTGLREEKDNQKTAGINQNLCNFI